MELFPIKNLEASAPITLTGDTIGFDYSATFPTYDARYVNLTGDVMTGNLSIINSASPIAKITMGGTEENEGQFSYDSDGETFGFDSAVEIDNELLVRQEVTIHRELNLGDLAQDNDFKIAFGGATRDSSIFWDNSEDLISFLGADISMDRGLKVDDTTLVVDAVTHFVGVGKAIPNVNLHVSNSNQFGDETTLKIGDFVFLRQKSYGLQINAGRGSQHTAFTGTGNVGIREESPETLLEMTSTVPYLTLHNNTEENSDGGRESRINFKGEQDGTEETTLARIEVSHDGTGDDEKGKFVISVNDGDDGDTLTDVIKISADGSTAIGDPGTTEMIIESDADTFWVGSGTGLLYGYAHGDHIAFSQVLAVDTWYSIADADIVSGSLNGVTHDGNGLLTVAKAGIYMVGFNVAYELNSANRHLEFGIEVDGAAPAVDSPHVHTTSKFSNQEQENAGTPVPISLTVGQTIQVAVLTTDSGNPTIIVDNVHLSCWQIGGI